MKNRQLYPFNPNPGRGSYFASSPFFNWFLLLYLRCEAVHPSTFLKFIWEHFATKFFFGSTIFMYGVILLMMSEFWRFWFYTLLFLISIIIVLWDKIMTFIYVHFGRECLSPIAILVYDVTWFMTSEVWNIWILFVIIFFFTMCSPKNLFQIDNDNRLEISRQNLIEFTFEHWRS